MKRVITRISVHKASWLLAACAACAFLASAIVQLPSALNAPEQNQGSRLGFLIAMPFLAGLGFYLLGLIFFSVYNLLAKKFGGIEVEVDESRPD